MNTITAYLIIKHIATPYKIYISHPLEVITQVYALVTTVYGNAEYGLYLPYIIIIDTYFSL